MKVTISARMKNNAADQLLPYTEESRQDGKTTDGSPG
jgi:hypothetical protein